MARVLISASHKSSGKTTISVGLAAALSAKGQIVQTFKKGPDYIDPMWLERASGRACYNLDFNTQTPEEISRLFESQARGANLALIEGNMGLHDGVDIEGSDSTAALARLLEAPVILVIDCEGMTRGVAALALGFQAFDKRVQVGGIILNNIAGSRQQAKLTAALERYCDIPVLGAVPRAKEMNILERHLGLTTPGDTLDERAIIVSLQRTIAEAVDVGRVLEIASKAKPLAAASLAATPAKQSAVTIALARDEAFGFYYADDMDALERAGARIVPFSPLRDEQLPDADGIFIGGGFPETHMLALEANATMREKVRSAANRGTPIYAECGGLMYLARSIRWRNETREMAGVIAGDVVMHDRPQGRGLVMLEQTEALPWPSAGAAHQAATKRIPAHEFHHAEIINLPADTRYGWQVLRGYGINGKNDGIVSGNTLASFSHLRDTSAHHWADRFIQFVRKVKAARQGSFDMACNSGRCANTQNPGAFR